MQQDSNTTTTASQAQLSLLGTPELTSLGAADQRASFYVMASVVAPDYKPDKRAPVDMICVIDRSGSMSGDRIAMAKSTVEFVVANLRHDDRLGIVTYDDSVSNHFPLRVMDEAGKDAAIGAIRSIAIGGSTNLCGGLVEGVTQMRSREAGRNDVASVLLFTDGQANAGYTRAEDIIKATVNPDFAAKSATAGGYGFPTQRYNSRQAYAQPPILQQQQQMQQQQQQQAYGAYPPQQQQQQSYGWGQSPVALQPNVVQAQNPVGLGGSPTDAEDLKKKKEEKDEEEKTSDLPLPCTINCFGFGADHDAGLLKKIADHGQGMYYYIDSTATIAEAFADCLAGLLSVVGQDIKVAFDVPEGSEGRVKINRVFTKFRSTEVEAGRSYELALGDIQSEERRDILIDLSIASTTDAESALALLKTTVTYTNVITGGEERATVTHTTTIKRPAQPTGETRNFEVDKQLNRLLAAEAMEQANEAARDGSVERAREIIKRASERIRESVSRDDDFCKSLVSDLARCEGGLQSQSAWAADGSKMLTNQMQAHYVQRSSNVAWAGQAAYQTSSRCAMQQNFKS